MGEIEKVLELFPEIDLKRILFTPNFAPKSEYEAALKLGVHVTVDNVYPLNQWGEIFSNQKIILRVDPGYGLGHHKFVCTGGTASKFGIPIETLNQVRDLSEKHNFKIVGLHIHSGSGILGSDSWAKNASILANLLSDFPDLKILNLGGGLGVVEKPGQQALDMMAVSESLNTIKKPLARQIEFWMEPGRFLVANAGVLLGRVTQIKHKGDTQFIGIETGMNSLIRPGLYGSYHEIVNLSKLDAPKAGFANIVGPICESGDTLGYTRLMPKTEEGDVILIANTGAYGFVMGSNYNLRPPAKEVYFTG